MKWDDDYCTMESVMADNRRNLVLAREYKVNYILIDEEYNVDIDPDDIEG